MEECRLQAEEDVRREAEEDDDIQGEEVPGFADDEVCNQPAASATIRGCIRLSTWHCRIAVASRANRQSLLPCMLEMPSLQLIGQAR